MEPEAEITVYLSTGAVARRLGLTAHAVRRAVRDGLLTAQPGTQGGHLRFSPSAVAAYSALCSGTSAPGMAERDPFFDLSMDPLCVAGLDGYFKRVNPAFSATLGWTAQQLLGRPYLDFIHPDDHEATLAGATRGGAGVSTARFENRYRRRDGSWCWLSWHSTTVAAEGLIYAVARDVTEQKPVQEALRASEERYRQVEEYAPIGLAIVASDGRWLRVNPALCRIVGYTAGELLAGTFQEITHPDDLDADLIYLRQTLTGEISTYQMEKRYLHKQGHAVWILLSVSLVRDAAGQPAYFIAQIQDIDSRKQTEAALRAETQRRAAIIATQRDIAQAALDLATVMRVITERAQALTGAAGAVVELVEGDQMVYRAVSGSSEPHLGLRLARATSLSGRCVTTAEILRCDDAESDARVDREACRRVNVRSMIVAPLQQEGRSIGVLKVLSPQPHAFDDTDVETLQLMVGLLAAAMDHALAFAAKQELLAERILLAHYDALTGLPNRALLTDRLTQALAEANRRAAPLAVLLLDLDGFKGVNDTLGHAAGDALLGVVADRLRLTLRASDTVSRLGGDEFVLLLTGTNEAGAVVAARKALAALAPPTHLHGQPAQVGGSIGIALHPAHGPDQADLLRNADMAMYQAKRGHLGYAVYSPEPAENAPRAALFV